MADVGFHGVTRRYAPDAAPAVDALDLQVRDGELMVLVGPSGSGKSTALRMLAGLEDVDEGRISIGERDVTQLSPGDRDVAMVFQDYALYPHLTVGENLAFPLRLTDLPEEDITRAVRESATVLGLQELLSRKPGALSGGQRQRVAMGRAIVRSPQVFCMDEPLSNLDAKLRGSTRTEIVALQARLGVTTVYVTHDQVEAMTMGDRIAVLRDGVLQQVDAPRALYERPVNTFVAGFLGTPSMNLLEAQASRNPGLLRILYEAGLVEAFGQGLDTVVSVLEAEEMQPPTFRDIGAAFIVTVYGRILDRDARPGFAINLTSSQRKIVLLLQERGELMISDIAEAIPDRSRRMLQDDMRTLVEADIVERSGQTRAVRYRLHALS